jgi:hypothetical protein
MLRVFPGGLKGLNMMLAYPQGQRIKASVSGAEEIQQNCNVFCRYVVFKK